MLYYVPIPDNSRSSSDSGAIIGGAVGGVILIIVMLCIVILCVRRSHRKKGSPVHVVDNTTILNTDVTIENNPSYDVTKANTLDHIYDSIKLEDSDVINPTYDVHTKPCSKTNEDEWNYIQPNEPTQHSDGYIKIYPNTDQSHGIRGIHSHSTANTPEQEEYGVVNQPQS